MPFHALLRAVRFMRWRDAALLVSGAGLIAWMVYLGVRFGDPFAFASVQGAPGWEQSGGPRTWFKVAFFGRAVLPRLGNGRPARAPGAGLPGRGAPGAHRLAAVRLGLRRLHLVSLAIPIIGTKDFMGTGRYVLAAYPVLAAAAIVLTGHPQAALAGAGRRRSPVPRPVRRDDRVRQRRGGLVNGPAKVDLLSVFFPMWNEEDYAERAVRAAEEECQRLIDVGEIAAIRARDRR